MVARMALAGKSLLNFCAFRKNTHKMIRRIPLSPVFRNVARMSSHLSSTLCRNRLNARWNGETSPVTMARIQCLHDGHTAYFPRKSDEMDVKNDPEVKKILREISEDFTSQNEQKRPETRENDAFASNNKSARYILYDDKDAKVIHDVHEELEMEMEGHETDGEVIETVHNPFSGLNLQRGVYGVFDVEDLIEVLISENARDICVIEVPEERSYADYLVLASAFSARHITAIIEFVNKVYKKKKHDSDPFLLVQGKDSQTWKVFDMGNIVLHVLTPEERAKYDIETLWSVGEEYDDHCQRPKDDEWNRLTQQLKELQEIMPSGSI